MRALVTGAAGFIGSHICEGLRARGWEVVAVDVFSPYYDLPQKRSNASEVASAGSRVTTVDLANDDLEPLVEGVDAVFHQAGQPGVRSSWDDFDTYLEHNVRATHRLLEAVRHHPLRRFVFASSSSVYGDALTYPTDEDTVPRPKSPYGVTKLAAEHLCGVYARNWAVPTVALRYFTVFGPRQRPDMAMHRLIEAALGGPAFPLYGSGSQVRDFTYVGDVVAANLASVEADVPPGSVMNIAGGDSTTLSEVIALVEEITGHDVPLDRLPPQAGDVERTGGSTERAGRLLGWAPSVSVAEGLRLQAAWHRSRLSTPKAG